MYCKLTTTRAVVSADLEKGRNNKAETSVTMEEPAETAKVLDFSAAEEPQAGTAKPAAKRKQQIVKSESLFLHLAQIIDANLKDEAGSQNFGPVLKNKGEEGKGPAADRILAFINASNHPLFDGKTTTVQTLRGWIEECKEAGEAEIKRREQVEGPGRRDGTEDKIPGHVEIWCDLLISWKEYTETTPKTDRYQVPSHLEGLVFLVKDNSPFLPTGSQLKKAGEEDRDAAVNNLKAGAAAKKQRIAEAVQIRRIYPQAPRCRKGSHTLAGLSQSDQNMGPRY